MERLSLKRADANKSLKSLQAVLQEPFSVIVRDAAIQRFEFTFEAFWKFTQAYLREIEGKAINSPKACFRELFASGLADEGQTEVLLRMTDRRNETAHTYKEELARAIFSEIGGFCALMTAVVKTLEKGMAR